MKFRAIAPTAVLALAVGLIPLAATPASAAAVTASGSCRAPDGGSEGSWTGTFSSLWMIRGISLRVYDEKADGHHVGIRLITYDHRGVKKYWPWHKVYDGNGHGKIWNTSAQDDLQIFYAKVQVATIEGTTVLSSCETPAATNPDL
ncbi:hypothetical protein ACIBJC_18190 [Streptomyces sp. NPDC050509]|uniref:hypothetical protein n=1 Tax=Streptomyces sp. NPDC050509 TaxID=3365620 RepID=UPI0037B7C3B5